MPTRTPRALLALAVIALLAAALATSVAARPPRVPVASDDAIRAAHGHVVAIIR